MSCFSSSLFNCHSCTTTTFSKFDGSTLSNPQYLTRSRGPKFEPIKAFPRKSIILLDPIFESNTLLSYLQFKGIDFIRVWSSFFVHSQVEEHSIDEGELVIKDPFTTQEEIDVVVEKLFLQLQEMGKEIIAVIPGTGDVVTFGTNLSLKLGLKPYCADPLTSLKNIFQSNEYVPKQCVGENWAEIEAFCQGLDKCPSRFLIKPFDSYEIDDLYLSNSMEELKKVVNKITIQHQAKKTGNKIKIVEYIEGIEYLVDFVSTNGQHRMICMWEHDRRLSENGQFLLYSKRLLTRNDKLFDLLFNFSLKMLEYSRVVDGPTSITIKSCVSDMRYKLQDFETRFNFEDPFWKIIKVINPVITSLETYLDENQLKLITLQESTLNNNYTQEINIKYLYSTIKDFNRNELVQFLENIESIMKDSIVIRTSEYLNNELNCVGIFGMTNKNRKYFLNDKKIIEMSNYVKNKLKNENCVCVIDPFSSGARLVNEIIRRNIQCVCVYAANLNIESKIAELFPFVTEIFVQKSFKTFKNEQKYDDSIDREKEALENVIEELQQLPWNIIAVISGCETAIQTADRIGCKLNVRNNGDELSEARRNKYVMGETIRAAGVRAVKQKCITNIDQLHNFLKEFNIEEISANSPVIAKPTESSGSDSVTKCQSYDELISTVNRILSIQNQLGEPNKSVLVQEYLDGYEYVVDFVSRDGVHKLAAIWKYDKRAVNGASFVYFGESLKDGNDAEVSSIIEYQKTVLDALGIKNGPSHGEVKLCHGVPILIEVGARCHGADGFWQQIEDEVYGNHQIRMTVDSYIDVEAFEKSPLLCQKKGKHGTMAMLVSYVEGKVVNINKDYIEELKQMKSFRKYKLFVSEGQYVEKTIDCFTFAGFVGLVHEDIQIIQKDYDRIREMELSDWFEVEPIGTKEI